MTVRPRPAALRLAALALALPLAACGGGGDDATPPLSKFLVVTAPYTAVPGAAIVVVGSRLLFLADEAGFGPAGDDLDGDGNEDDQVVVAVDLGTQKGDPHALAAAEAYTLVGSRAYVAGYEPGLTTLSLLTFDLTLDPPVLVKLDEIDPASPVELARAGDRVFWATAAPTATPGETSLRYVETTAPETPVTVLAADGTSLYKPRLLGAAGGLALLALDETVELVDLNGDLTATDTAVLALADGLATTPAVRPVGLPLAGPSSPVSVHVLPTDERRVAFLVDETAHATNLNAAGLPGFGAGWEFGACVGTPDVDTTDEVLHWLLFETWDATLSTPVNTGLVGSNRILQNNGYLATLAAEADQGPAGCDWSGDGTADDLVLRWVPDDTAAIVPENTVPLQEEVVSKPGGSLGVVALGQAFVAVVNASVAVPGVGNVQTDWLATVRPGESTAWRFLHGTANVPLGPDWLAPAAQSNRIGSTFREAPYGTSWNATPCGVGAPKDTDATDVVPIYPEFDDAQNKLTFPGASYAVQASNGGVSIAGAIAYFRVSEADDEVDYTGDGQQDDTVLVRNSVATCAPVVMSVLNSDFGPAVVTDGVYGAGFLCDENQTDGVDLNADGDTTDRVLRWFRF